MIRWNHPAYMRVSRSTVKVPLPEPDGPVINILHGVGGTTSANSLRGCCVSHWSVVLCHLKFEWFFGPSHALALYIGRGSLRSSSELYVAGVGTSTREEGSPASISCTAIFAALAISSHSPSGIR